jgi:hypothetical protein
MEEEERVWFDEKGRRRVERTIEVEMQGEFDVKDDEVADFTPPRIDATVELKGVETTMAGMFQAMAKRNSEQKQEESEKK